ncbi:MAG: redoxin domain-containing protein [Alphaproteobacteria bacterium]|nr:redoxin domain-containing protein [Alphaproteobacteria bacterium]
MAKNIVPALVLGLALIAAPAALAHSLEELESMLGDREKYFQPMDKEAPDFTLSNADGGTVRLTDLRGKVVVLHFIYASCPDVCPLHAERIAEVQSMGNQTPMRDAVQFVSITTDPTRDTPDIMRNYGGAHGLDAVNWIFLTTSPGQPEDATRKLAEAYGHKFKKTEDSYQTHGIVTHVIDKEGRWRGNFHGLRFSPPNLVLLVNALVNDYHDGAAVGSESLWDKIRNLF